VVCYFNLATADQHAIVAFGTVAEIDVTIDSFQPSCPARICVRPCHSEQSNFRRNILAFLLTAACSPTLRFRLTGASRFISDVAASSAHSPEMSSFRACTCNQATTIIKVDGGAIAFQFASIEEHCETETCETLSFASTDIQGDSLCK